MAFVHLDRRREAVSGRRVASRPSVAGLLRGQSDGVAALLWTDGQMAVLQRTDGQMAVLQRGTATLGRGTFRLLQGLLGGARRVLAAAPASVLAGQQALPLGLVVREMA